MWKGTSGGERQWTRAANSFLLLLNTICASKGNAVTNVYALAQYLAAVDRAMDDIQAGKSLDAALAANFCDRLLDTCRKAIR